MISQQKQFVWKLLLAAIILMMAAGIYGATKRIDYTWRWERVPQYFVYHDESLVKAPEDSRVVGIN